MSQQTMKVTERVQGGRGPMGGGHFGGGMIAEKSQDFAGSARRFLGYLRPNRVRSVAVLALAAISVGFAVMGPKMLGRATDHLFSGIIGAQLGVQFPGETKDQIVQQLQGSGATGADKFAQMIQSMNVVPGQGVDFNAVGQIIALVLLIYFASSLAAWLQGWLVNDVVQAAVLRMRDQVETKLHRLPLRYFDKQPRGELLSRVTNDIDNVSQTLQQTMSQLLTSLLTVIGLLGDDVLDLAGCSPWSRWSPSR